MQETTNNTVSDFPYNLLLDLVNEGHEEWTGNFPADIDGTVAYILSRFSDRVQKIIIGRYRDGKTYEQLGRELGVTRERIRQIEQKAKRYMRHFKCRELLTLGIAEYIAQTRINAAKISAEGQIAAATGAIRVVADRLSKLTGDGEMSVMEGKAADLRLRLPIEDLDLSTRAYNCLLRANLRTVGDVVNCRKLHQVRNLGKKSLEEVVRKIRELGFEIEVEQDAE